MRVLTDFKRRHELRKRDQQEEQVEEELELIHEHQGQKGNKVILLVVQFVGAERSRHCAAPQSEHSVFPRYS